MAEAKQTQVSYAIQVLMMFVKAALNSKTLPPQFVKMVREKCLVLLEKLQTDQIESSLATKELRKITNELNQVLSGEKEHIPYPTFAEGPVENQVKSNIMAFELFLNHKLQAGELTLDQEGPLFSKAVILWNGVGQALSSKEAMSTLVRLIHKMNGYLPHREKYPVPDDTQY
jgi:hypothetical protein